MTHPDLHIDVSLGEQRLRLWQGGRRIIDEPVSTGRNGPGELNDSGCTPRGLHRVRARIGDGCPLNSVFVARRPTGEIYTPELARAHPNRDWILTRILWLGGLEVGRNRLGSVDTMRRYIYIHGAPPEAPMGVAASHGCIRVAGPALLELFDRVAVGTRVYIHED
jgi:L,D-transpeptidase YbiS